MFERASTDSKICLMFVEVEKLKVVLTELLNAMFNASSSSDACFCHRSVLFNLMSNME